MQFRTINFTHDNLSQKKILCVNISTRDDEVHTIKQIMCMFRRTRDGEWHLKMILNKYKNRILYLSGTNKRDRKLFSVATPYKGK